MEKIGTATPDLVQANIQAIAELFPNVVTETLDEEGNLTRAVDFDQLRQELSDHVVDGPRERYQLDWPGKRAAMLAANAPTRSTLRPMLEESVDFDTTKNLFIEGDNLEALKILQESYLGKVKLIYIDPPYNTGNDFIYNDDFSQSTRDYLSLTGQVNEGGVRLTTNTESNGRFHSDWLSMMYPRLKLARNLLRSDGMIYVSIDDNEVANLRRLLDLVFGERNFIENYIWESNFRPDNSSRIERENAQHVLCYARDRTAVSSLVGSQKVSEGLPSLTKNSMKESTISLQPEWVDFMLPDGDYPPGTRSSGYTLVEPIQIRNGKAVKPFSLTGKVIWSQRYLEEQVDSGTRIVIKGDGFVPYSKKTQTAALAPTTLLPRDVVGDVLAGNADVRSLFAQQVFSHPKPVSLLQYLISSCTHDDPDAIIMDFFAGSGTTGQAVATKNVEDGGRRSWILVQLPEPVPSDSNAAEMGFENIAQISRERMRRCGNSLRSAVGMAVEQFDFGFRSLYVEASAFRDVLRSPDVTTQLSLENATENIATDRSNLDLLFQVLLNWGMDLTLSIGFENRDGAEIIDVDGGGLVACFSEVVTNEVVRDIAARSPLRVVFRDSSFESDAERINVEQIFRELSPDTQVRVI